MGYKRYMVLLVCLIIQACLGGIYAWSTFVPPLENGYGLSRFQTQLIFGVTFVLFTGTAVLIREFQARTGPRITGLISGFLFAAGYLTAGSSGGSFPLLLLGIGVLCGTGIGFGYMGPLTTCIQWFPRHRGLVTGLAVAGFGGGAVLLSSGVTFLLNRQVEVLMIFQIVGLVQGGLIILSSTFVVLPKQKVRSAEPEPLIPLKALLVQPAFRSLGLGMFCGTFAGMLIIGNLKPIGQSFGVDTMLLPVAISAFAIGNASGRIIWGWIADKINFNAIVLSLLFLWISVLLMIMGSDNQKLFILTSGLVGFGFGACFVVYAAQVAATYSVNKVGAIYPLIFLMYGLSGLIGPTIGGGLFEWTGHYRSALMLASMVAFLGAGGVWCFWRTHRLQQPILSTDPFIAAKEPLTEFSLTE